MRAASDDRLSIPHVMAAPHAAARGRSPHALRPPTVEETAIVGVALLTWALALLAVATGNGRFADHHALMGRRTLPWALGLLSFLATWQVMIAAKMLPTSLPMIRLFARASGGQARSGLVRAVFVAVYLAVWTGFAALAYVCDAALHALAVRAGWPGDHPAAIMGSVLLLAGGSSSARSRSAACTNVATRRASCCAGTGAGRGRRGRWVCGTGSSAWGAAGR